MTTINITNNIIHDPLEFLKLTPQLAEKYPEEFLSQIEKVDFSLRYRIFMDFIKDIESVSTLEFLLAEIESQIRIRKCLTNKK